MVLTRRSTSALEPSALNFGAVRVGRRVTRDRGGLRAGVIHARAGEVDGIVRGGCEAIIVTSGGVAAGRARLGKLHGTTIAARQAAAAAGQIELMGEWARAFAARGRTVAQILLTHQALAERRRRLNARPTIASLLRAGAIDRFLVGCLGLLHLCAACFNLRAILVIHKDCQLLSLLHVVAFFDIHFLQLARPL